MSDDAGSPSKLLNTGDDFRSSCEESDKNGGQDDNLSRQSRYFNRLNLFIFVAYFFSSVSVAVPVSLITTVSNDLMSEGDSKGSFSARVAAWAVAGTSLGKAINGFVGDSCGARRTMSLSFLFQAAALVLYSNGEGANSVGLANLLLEFFNSVHWPCMTIVLSTHCAQNKDALEAGVMVLGLSSRAGALLGIPIFSLLNSLLGWRQAAFWSAMVPLVGFAVVFLFIEDAPGRTTAPQGNGLSVSGIFKSLKDVLGSRLFWLISLAQVGNGMVRTSERILGGFFSETTGLDDDEAGGLTAVLSGGLLAGVLIFGAMFVKKEWKDKRILVRRLYVGCGVALALLGAFSVPMVVENVGSTLMLGIEVTLVFLYAMCVGVQYYSIPSLLASTFGENKGLCSAYIDGVAYFCTSFFWTGFSWIVGQGDYGWMCGWGLLGAIITGAAISMNHFMTRFWAERWGVEAQGETEAKEKLLREAKEAV